METEDVSHNVKYYGVQERWLIQWRSRRSERDALGEAEQNLKSHGCNRGSTIGLTKVRERGC